MREAGRELMQRRKSTEEKFCSPNEARRSREREAERNYWIWEEKWSGGVNCSKVYFIVFIERSSNFVCAVPLSCARLSAQFEQFFITLSCNFSTYFVLLPLSSEWAICWLCVRRAGRLDLHSIWFWLEWFPNKKWEWTREWLREKRRDCFVCKGLK